MLLLLDDLQWADELTLGWLEHLLRTERLGRVPLLFLGTYRSEELGPHRDAALQRLIEAPGAVPLRLGRLDAAAVGRIVSDMLALEGPPEGFVRFLARHSEGNPFFVAEYLRVAIAEGVLYRSKGLWQVAQESREPVPEGLYEALPLPRSLRETVQRRLETLSPEAQHLAEAAAVLGREVDESLLLAVIQREAGYGLEALEELRVREVLEETTAGSFRFAHDKLREVAYERIGAEPRHALHRAAAEAIEAGRPAAPVQLRDERLATLGHHWEQAGARDKARGCYLAAARTARDRYALNDAYELYRAYLRLVERETAESIEARSEAAYEVLYPQGKMDEAKVLLEQALGLARQSGDLRLEATLLGNLGWLHNQQAELEEARALYDQALAVSRQAGDRPGEGTALNRLGVLHKDQGLVQEARSLYEQALAVALDIGDQRLEEVTLGNLGWLLSQKGKMEEAWALYERGLAIARHNGDRAGEGMMLGRMGTLLSFLGRIEESRALQEQALGIQREIGNPRNEGRDLGNLGVLYFDQGQLEEAWEWFEQALAVQRQINDRLAEALTLGHQGLVRAAQNRPNEARALCEKALAFARQLGDRLCEGTVLGYLGSVLGDQGLVDEALRLCSEALAILRQVGSPRIEGWVLAHLARQRRRTSPHPDKALELAQACAAVLQSSGRDLLPLAVAEQGHALLGAGRSAAAELQEVRALSSEFGRTGATSECGRALARLERAQAAFEAGRPLFRGEIWEDIPEGLRCWLIENGQAGEPFTGSKAGASGEP
jgi:tetratricopeptide (TPR) repeat protein